MILPLPFWIWVPILMFQFQGFFVLTNIGEFHLIISFLPAYLPLLFSSLLQCLFRMGYLWLSLPRNFWHDPSLSSSNCHRLSCLAWMQLAKLPFSTNSTSAKFCLLFLLSVGCTYSIHLYKIHTISTPNSFPLLCPHPLLFYTLLHCFPKLLYVSTDEPTLLLFYVHILFFTFLCILYLIHFKLLLWFNDDLLYISSFSLFPCKLIKDHHPKMCLT